VYWVRVTLDRTKLNVEGIQRDLSPGMMVSVEIKTGRRRIIEFLLSPLLQHGSESLKER